MRLLIALILFIFLSDSLMGQVWDRRSLIIPPHTVSVNIDTLSLVPGSTVLLTLQGDTIDSAHFEVLPLQAELKMKKTYADTLMLFYRVMPLNLLKVYRNRIYREPQHDVYGRPDPFSIVIEEEKPDIFLTDGLNKNGSISRGITAGNNQDLTVNSNMDLQLSGKVSDDIHILAAISDNNIPIQPEGNTQQLQDFDQVYIQLFNERSRLVAGDFQLTDPPGYFMTFFKRAQGAMFSTTVSPVPGDTSRAINFTASGAVSRGKFARNVIQGMEGNQGPYRLYGNDNETFIIILSGTERVFIDGVLQTRGQEHDYIIDYNTAEITFTANRQITKDKRIIVEFQYTDRSYARSLLFNSTSYRDSLTSITLNLYSEQDSRNQPLQQELDLKRKQFLAGVGDDILNAAYPSLDTSYYRDDIILYQLTDTLVNGVLYDSVLVFTPEQGLILYRAVFSKVGSGNGNYILQPGAANGKIFTWVAPLNGLPQGDYEPVTVLVTPKKRQMASVTAEHRISRQFTVGGEAAISVNDLNTFSSLDAHDDQDYAFKGWVSRVIKTHGDSGWIISKRLMYEQVNKYFTPVERFRPVEFERDWNLAGRELLTNQRMGEFLFQAQRGGNLISLHTEAFHMDTTYLGIRQNLDVFWRSSGFDHDIDASVLRADAFGEESSFYRWRSRSVKKFAWISPGIAADAEWNTREDANADSLLNTSYMYHELEGFIQQGDSARDNYYLGYRQRSDYAVSDGALHRHSFAENVGFSFEWLKFAWSNLKTVANYRRLTITDSSLTTQKPENTLLGRVEYSLRMLKGTIVSDTWYETGSGLEQKKYFTYIEVAAGQGVYAWLGDLNENGIKDLSEFEIAQFPDQARYVRVYTPSLDYVRTYTNQFSQSLQINPERVWGNAKGFKKLVGRFATQTALRVERKTTFEEAGHRFNPFVESIADTALVSANSSLRNVVFFNRSHPVYGLDHTWHQLHDKSLLVNGFEARENRSQLLRGRVNLTRAFMVSVELEDELKSLSSQFASARNYEINTQSISPRMAYQPGTAFRTALVVNLTRKLNHAETGESLFGRTLGLEFRYAALNKGNLSVEANYIVQDFTGMDGTIVSYEMLDGLQPGKNVTWNLLYQRNLSKHMQLNLSYQGRVSEHSPAVHTGSVQVRAYF